MEQEDKHFNVLLWDVKCKKENRLWHKKKELKKYVEQKPAWREEDEYTLETLLIRLCNEQNIYPQLSSNFQEIQAIKVCLKSLKERIGE